MYNILAFLLIALSLLVILVVIIRKFPQLALIDVESLPEVKEEKKKDEYLLKKFEQKKKMKGMGKQSFVSFITWFKRLQLKFRMYVGFIERQVLTHAQRKRMPQTPEEFDQTMAEVKKLLNEAQQASEQDKLDIAESKYIAIIRLDARNIEAYRGLGDVYFRQGQLEEAAQTCQFLLHIDKKDDAAHIQMAKIAEAQGDIDEAISHYQQAILLNDNIATRFAKLASLLKEGGQREGALESIQQAVELEPENPKYLDNLVELAILVSDKKLAEQGFQQLRMVNPENQKLDLLREKIEKIESVSTP